MTASAGAFAENALTLVCMSTTVRPSPQAEYGALYSFLHHLFCWAKDSRTK